MQTTAELTYGLQLLEVVLRNSMHDALSNMFSAHDWYDTPGLLGNNEIMKLAEVRRKLGRSNKSITPDNVVAESSFGFWTSMINNYYENKIYKKHPSIIKQMFPFTRANRL